MPVLRSPALPAQAAAGADATTFVDVFQSSDSSGTGVSRAVVVAPPGYATVTGVATNNATISLRQVRAGSVVATFASLTLAAGTNLVAEVPVSIPVTTPVNLAPDDVVDVVLHQNGTGLAVNAGLFVIVNVS